MEIIYKVHQGHQIPQRINLVPIDKHGNYRRPLTKTLIQAGKLERVSVSGRQFSIQYDKDNGPFVGCAEPPLTQEQALELGEKAQAELTATLSVVAGIISTIDLLTEDAELLRFAHVLHEIQRTHKDMEARLATQHEQVTGISNEMAHALDKWDIVFQGVTERLAKIEKQLGLDKPKAKKVLHAKEVRK